MILTLWNRQINNPAESYAFHYSNGARRIQHSGFSLSRIQPRSKNDLIIRVALFLCIGTAILFNYYSITSSIRRPKLYSNTIAQLTGDNLIASNNYQSSHKEITKKMVQPRLVDYSLVNKEEEYDNTVKVHHSFSKDQKVITREKNPTFKENGKEKRQMNFASELVQEYADRKNEAAKKTTEWYKYAERDPLYETTQDGQECVPMQDWQTYSFPTCNAIHEIPIQPSLIRDELTYYAHGGYNTIFYYAPTTIHSKYEKIILKILLYDLDPTDRNLDRVRREALLMERLTKSPYIQNIYAYCGMATIVPFSSTSMQQYLYPDNEKNMKLSTMKRFVLATQVAFALRDAHDIDHTGVSSIVHGDLLMRQYLLSSDIHNFGRSFQLSDFNRGRFIRLNQKNNASCTYTVEKNDDTFRSPEEYQYLPQTSKVDVWALGNILYELLTGISPWKYDSEKKKEKHRQSIIDGKLPELPSSMKDSDNALHQALITAIYDMCLIYDPLKRATAVEVANYLQQQAHQNNITLQNDYFYE